MAAKMDAAFKARRKKSGLTVDQQIALEDFQRLVGMTTSSKLAATIASLELARREALRERDEARAKVARVEAAVSDHESCSCKPCMVCAALRDGEDA